MEIKLLFVLAFLLLAAAIYFLLRGRQQRQASGLPAGRIIYDDSGARQRTLERPLFEPTLGLAGKPDYLLEAKKGELIPVEVKSGNAPEQPYENHIMQLAAYCYLVDKTLHRRPLYGVIRYQNRSFAVDYTAELEESFLDVIADMRYCERSGEMDRSHEVPARCFSCGYRRQCDQRLS